MSLTPDKSTLALPMSTRYFPSNALEVKSVKPTFSFLPPQTRYMSMVVTSLIKILWEKRGKKEIPREYIVQEFSRFLANIQAHLGLEYSFDGFDVLREIQRSGQSVVFAANHMSAFDTHLIPNLILPFTPICYVVKKQLLTVPGYGRLIKAMGAIALERKSPKHDMEQLISEGVKALEDGHSVVIHPEGTRSYPFDPSRFSSTGARLAKAAGVPIVPLALKTDCWLPVNHSKVRRRLDAKKTVYASFGDPLDTKSTTLRELRESCRNFISEKLALWEQQQHLKEMQSSAKP